MPDIELITDNSSSEIEAVLDCRKLGRRYDYLVHWTDSSISDRSWVPLSDIPAAMNEMLERFHRRHPRLPRPPRIQFDSPPRARTDRTAPVATPASIIHPVRLMSPPPQRAVQYEAPSRTTTRSGRIARPPQRFDPPLGG